jgi:hypothetical protein
MLKTDISLTELELESAELLPDRDTMQPVLIGSFAVNAAELTQTATSGNVTITVTYTGGG